MIESNEKLSQTRQCQLLSLARSTFYYQPQSLDNEKLALLRKLDEQYLKSKAVLTDDFLKKEKALGDEFAKKEAALVKRYDDALAADRALLQQEIQKNQHILDAKRAASALLRKRVSAVSSSERKRPRKGSARVSNRRSISAAKNDWVRSSACACEPTRRRTTASTTGR